jgi:hypothetical protein
MVQPRKAARKVCRWAGVSRRKSFRTYIYARITGTRDKGIATPASTNRSPGTPAGNQGSNFLSKAGLLEPDTNCCSKSQSISIEVLRGDFARKTVPIFSHSVRVFPLPILIAAQRPCTERKLR